MKKYMQTIANMYDRMNNMESWSYDFVDYDEFDALTKLQVSDLSELKKICSGDCIGTLIIKSYNNMYDAKLNEFNILMQNLCTKIPAEVFNYIINYNSESPGLLILFDSLLETKDEFNTNINYHNIIDASYYDYMMNAFNNHDEMMDLVDDVMDVVDDVMDVVDDVVDDVIMDLVDDVMM